MAVLLGEPDHERCEAALKAEPEVLISAGTLAEVLIVAGRRGLAAQMAGLIQGMAFTVVPVSEAFARKVAAAYDRWGKGIHSAGLNFGDCFAYALAKEHDCPLLYVGEDFAKTDLPPGPTSR